MRLRSPRLAISVAVGLAIMVVPARAADATASAPATTLPSLAGGTLEQPVFHATDLLERSQLTGPEYTVEDMVAVKASRFQFVLRTPYGRIPADGSSMFELRAEEMRAIERARRLAKEPQVVNGIMDSFRQTGQGLEALVTDPGETLMNIPKGIGRKIKSMTDKSSRRGGGETRRTFAAELGADPETRNPVLKKLLDKLSMQRGIGQSVIGVATIGATGGVAMAAQAGGALRTTADMQKTLRTTPLYKINQRTASELIGLGVEPETARAFSENLAFTTLQRLLLLEQYNRFHAVQGAPYVLELATRAETEPDALAVIRLAGMLAQLHARSPIDRISPEGLPVAKLKSGSLVAISAGDYVAADSAWLARAAALRKAHANEPLFAWLAGRASPTARRSLTDAEFEIVENERVDAIK